MELPLLVSKIALQRMRSPNAEILDILSARSVEHHIEAMERLNIGNEFYPLLTGDGVLSENLPDLLKYRIVCDYIFAPLGRENTIQRFQCFCFPVFLRSSNDVGALRDIRIRTRHHREALLVDYDIRAQQIKQRVQVVVTCLQRSRGQHYDSVCVLTEVVDALICKCLVLLHAAIAQMVGLINDDQIKMRCRV